MHFARCQVQLSQVLSQGIMDYDVLLPEIGAFGRYQKILIGIVLIPTVFPCAWNAYSQLFIAAIPGHHCRVPELDGWFEKYPELVKQLTIPVEGSSLKYSQCEVFNRNYTEINARFQDIVDSNWNVSSAEGIVKCQNGWHYDQTLYPSTAASQVSLRYKID